MRFKPAGRRPDRALPALQVFTFLLFPLLVGEGDSVRNPAFLGDSNVQGTVPGVFWIFLSPDSWNTSAFWSVLEQSRVRTRFRSEWLRGVSVEVGTTGADRLRQLPGVRDVRPVSRLPVISARPGPMAREEGDGWAVAVDSAYGDLGVPLGALGIIDAHDLGFTGAGVRIGVLDGTFRPSHAILRTRPPLAERDFVDLDGSVASDPGDPPEAASHGTALWSLVAGDLPGTLRGGAPGADVLLARVRAPGVATHVDEDRWVAGLEWLESQGARVVLSGVAFRNFADSEYTAADLDGDKAPATRAADEAAERGVLVVAPVGNGGPSAGSLSSPADGDSVMAVGAVDSQGVPVPLSAQGPTADGREKPDLFGPGASLPAASGLDDESLERVTGTEFAGALLAAGGALLIEAYPSQGPMEVLEILAASASRGVGLARGIPNVASAILFPGGIMTTPVEEVDQNGQLGNLAPQFRWTVPALNPLGLPVTFHIQLAEDSLFQTVLRSDAVVGTFARRPPHPLPPRTRLFWRVVAESAQGIQRASENMGPLLVPPWVTLLVLNEPAGSEVSEVQPHFRWSTPELLPPLEPLVFELQIVSDRETEIVESFPGLTETAFQVPSPLPFNVPLRWRIIARDGEASADTVTSTGPFVITSGASPPATILYQNFPNPFPDLSRGVTDTRIWFDLAESASVELAVFDIRGRLVRHLIPERGCGPVTLPAGTYGRGGEQEGGSCQSYSWDGRDDSDRELPQGIYLLRLEARGIVDVRRMVFWR